MFDTLFCNARIVDGTGTPWFWGSLGVHGFVAAVLPRTTKPSMTLTPSTTPFT